MNRQDEPIQPQYTIAIFRHLYEFVAPVLPGELRDEMRHALEHVEQAQDVSRDDVEETMIVFGRRVWPYRKALQDVIELHEGTLGEEFFERALSRAVARRFEEFKSHGGTLGDVHSGGALQFFSAEERVELQHALVDMHGSLRTYALQDIRGIGSSSFETKVTSFATLFEKLSKELEDIRRMADDAQEHPMLAREMREHVRAFEHGLVLLGPEFTPDDVARAKEHFTGRRQELIVRGIIV